MGTYEDDAPRLSEIGRVLHGLDRKIDDFRHEVRAQLNDKMSKEVYEARMAAMNEKVANVQAEALGRLTTLENSRKSLTNTVYGGLASIVVGVILFFIQTRS